MYNPYKYNKIEEFSCLIKSEVFDYMMENDSDFRMFVSKNKDKAIEVIAKEYNIDLEMLSRIT